METISAIKKSGMIACILVSLLFFAAAAVCFGNSYDFDPEETIYLAGIEMAAYKENVRYSLYDIDKDGTSELFILTGSGDTEELEIFRFDPAAKEVRMIFKLDDTAEVFGDSRENCVITLSENSQKRVYRKFAVVNDALAEDAAFAGSDDGSANFMAVPEESLQPLVWIGSDQWVDGSIVGVASRISDPGPHNDFYLSSNYAWLSEMQINSAGEINGWITDLEDAVIENKRIMFADREHYQGADIQIVRDFYDAAVNWEKRDADGIEPVKKYLDAAASVSSLSELTDYLTDPELNPFSFFLSITITLDEKDTSHWATEIAEDNFSVLPRIHHNEDRESIEEVRHDFDARARHVLLRAGYSEQETEEIMAGCYEMEEILLPLAWPGDEDEKSPLYGFLPFDTVVDHCRAFPLKRLLNAYHIAQGKIHVYYPAYLEKLDELYTEENLPMMRSYLMAHTAAAASDHLDSEAASCLEDSEISKDELKRILNGRYQSEALSSREIMGVAVENAYMTFFADPETRADLIGLAEEIRNTFRERLIHEDWLSDAGKTAALEKLDNMTFSVMAPDVLIDSSYLAVNKDESFLDNYARITVNRLKHNGSFAGRLREKGDWRYDLRPEIASSYTNAFYYGCFNQFFIFSGFVTDSIYRPDMPIEEKLAGLGEIIGHELTHGFDPNGIRYDKNGDMVLSDEAPYGWMPRDDYLAFMARAQRISDHFDHIRPLPYDSCPGEIQWGEAAADIGGLTIGLDIASKHEGFDYDRFFRAYSELWCKQSTLAWEHSDIYDEHPLNHLRINVTVQQFDEFLETYQVHEGDGMYLDPADRIKIW